MASGREGGIGCGTLIAIFVAIALILAAAISIAAIVDPFSWVPSLHQIFGCTDNPQTTIDECDTTRRYPDFWFHVVINLLYVFMSLGLLVALARALPKYRDTRSRRFESDTAIERYRQARQEIVFIAALLAGLAALPIIVALA